MYAI
jgi:transcriptional adapter 2-alpha